MKITLFVRSDDVSKTLANKIRSDLVNLGLTCDDKNPDIVIFVGGDGTLLRAVHHYLDRLDKITFVGVRTGTLGFFCDYTKDNLDALYKHLVTEIEPVEYHLIEAEIAGLNKKDHIFAVNEIRIENPFHTLSTGIYVDDQLIHNFNGNGLIISSQLGSTAYNRSLGGALVEQGLEVLQLQEIAPLSNAKYRPMGSPLVLKSTRKVTFKPVSAKTLIGYDYKTLSLNEDYEITIFMSDKKVKLLHNENKNYFEVLRTTFINE